MPKFTRSEIRKIVGEHCTDEIENALISLHLGVVDSIKDELDAAKAEAGKVEELTQQIKTLEAEKGYREKFDKVTKEFDEYKKSITAKETRAAKETAVRAYFEKKGITGANLDIAIRGAREEIDSAELDGDKLKDTKAFDALVAGTYKGLVGTQRTVGAKTPTPPTSGTGTTYTREDIYRKDDKGRYVMDASERQHALAEIIANEHKK